MGSAAEEFHHLVNNFTILVENLTKTGNELQGKATQNEIATKNDHKCDVLILHIFPTLFQVLHDLGTFTLHHKTANPSAKKQ